MGLGLERNTPTSDTVLKERSASLTPIILGVPHSKGTYPKKVIGKVRRLGWEGGDKTCQFQHNRPSNA